MRLRILQVPKQSLGPATEMDFGLVLDKVSEDEATELAAGDAAHMKDTTGAVFVLAFPYEVDLD